MSQSVALVRVVCVDWVSRPMDVERAQAWAASVQCSNEHTIVADAGQTSGSTGRYWEGEEE